MRQATQHVEGLHSHQCSQEQPETAQPSDVATERESRINRFNQKLQQLALLLARQRAAEQQAANHEYSKEQQALVQAGEGGMERQVRIKRFNRKLQQLTKQLAQNRAPKRQGGRQTTEFEMKLMRFNQNLQELRQQQTIRGAGSSKRKNSAACPVSVSKKKKTAHWRDEDYEMVAAKEIEVQEKDGRWRKAVLYPYKHGDEIVLWFGEDEYEGLGGGARVR